MIELAFMKEFILIKQVHQKSLIYVTVDIFLNSLSLNRMSPMGVMAR